MPRKKPPADPDAGVWRVISEDMRAQFRVFGDALNFGLRELDQRMAEGFEKTGRRLDALESAVRQNSADIRGLTTRVEKLEGIEERVTALEQRRR